MFLFKKNKIHIDCFTCDETIAQDNPIQKTSNFIPEWWKKMPNSFHQMQNNVEVPFGTMKSCLGFIDLYSKGLVIPLWSDLNIKVEKNNINYVIAKNTNLFGNSIEFHDRVQYGNSHNNHIHFKLISPWYLKEKSGVKFLLTSCIWNMLENFPKIHIVNGILEFSKLFITNINGFMSLENQPYQYNIEIGMPLVQLIPLSEKSVVPHIQVLNDAEWKKMNHSTVTNKFTGWGIYKSKLKNRK